MERASSLAFFWSSGLRAWSFAVTCFSVCLADTSSVCLAGLAFMSDSREICGALGASSTSGSSGWSFSSDMVPPNPDA